eukprot:170914-Chlamydomonas_euryale.AAC.3
MGDATCSAWSHNNARPSPASLGKSQCTGKILQACEAETCMPNSASLGNLPAPAHFSCILHCACTLRQHTAPAHCASTLRQHTAPAHCASTLRQHTAPAHCASTLRQHTAPAHCACTLRLHHPIRRVGRHCGNTKSYLQAKVSRHGCTAIQSVLAWVYSSTCMSVQQYRVSRHGCTAVQAWVYSSGGTPHHHHPQPPSTMPRYKLNPNAHPSCVHANTQAAAVQGLP